MNIFDALNIFYKEDTISDFLINCFKDSDDFLIHFLEKAQIHLENNTIFHIYTRVGLGKSIGTPDIVIRASSDKSTKLIIVENKMGSAEGDEQTNRYESPEARKRMIKRFDLNAEKTDFHFIFLALDTTTRPTNSKFSFLNYQVFLEGIWNLKETTLKFIFMNFQEKLRDFYIPVRNPYSSLEGAIIMDRMQRKICWQNILYETISPIEDLELSWGEYGGSGRNNFLFLIRKKNWTSDSSFQYAGLFKTFNVHIDIYVNMLDNKNKGINEIGIRFETFPYKPHNNIHKLPGYDAFMENKKIFSEKLFAKVEQNNIPAKIKNTKLLVMSISIGGEGVREKVQNIKKQVQAVKECIDEVIEEMKSKALLQ